MKTRMPRVWVGSIVAIMFVGTLIGLIFASTKHRPDFYSARLNFEASVSEHQGKMFERRLADLHNQIRREGDWSTLLEEDQVNGWLASDLPEKFPDVLGNSIQRPRVLFSEDRFKLAFELRSTRFQGIVQVAGDIFATQNTNQIAFRVESVRSGIFPIPIAWWADHLAGPLRNRDVILEWSELDGDPVALLTLPRSFSIDADGVVTVTGIQLTDKAIGLSGQTVLKSVQPDDEHQSVAGSQDSIQH